MTVWGAVILAALFPAVGGGLAVVQRFSSTAQMFARRVLVAFAIALLAMLVFRPDDNPSATFDYSHER